MTTTNLLIATEVPSTPYLQLPSSSPSRAGTQQIVFASAFSSVHSSTAPMIQADIFSSCGSGGRWSSTIQLFRFRLMAAIWLVAFNIWIPLCEYSGGSCRVGVARNDSDGELGNLSGEGQPNPNQNASPAPAQERTLWLIASLSYVMSALLCIYFLLLLCLAYFHRMLFKQCTSYPYESLCIVSHASTSAHPLTWSQKMVGLLFQLVVPTTIGMNILYWTFILPYRQPLSWFVSLHLHLFTGIIAFIELEWNRFVFRPKALFYWCFLCLLYLLLLMVIYILGGDRWEYSNMNWNHSASIAALTWIFACLFLGPIMFLLCALLQYLRDGRSRGLLTSAVDIGHASQQAHRSLVEHSQLAARGAYIQGTLARYAQMAPSTPTTRNQTPLRTFSNAHSTQATSLNGNGHSNGNGFLQPPTTSVSADANPPPPSQPPQTSLVGRSINWIVSWFPTTPEEDEEA